MRNDVKELADAMERGWSILPHMSFFMFFQSDHPRFNQWNFREFKANSACAQGHALLGTPKAKGINDRHTFFPILMEQRVFYKRPYNFSEEISLGSAIDKLVSIGWTTPQVVEWLRSHQND